MYTLFPKIRLLVFCCAFSILVHILFMYVLKMFGTYDFTAPVSRPQVVVVDLAQPRPAASETAPPKKVEISSAEAAPKEATAGMRALPAHKEDLAPKPAVQEQPRPEPKTMEKPVVAGIEDESVAASGKTANADAPVQSPMPALEAETVQPAPTGSKLAASKYEKLSYVINMLGISIGTAELEARHEAGINTIALRVRSNAAISAFFPVDDVVETSHIDGKFIVTRIKQQEGAFRSDVMFSINPGRKRVSWVDLLHNRNLKMTIPNEDVLDTLSGIYYIRTRQLEVGRTEILHIFDSEVYAEVPVEILRREEMRLPNLTKIKTLVVRPLQKTAGIFRRTGEVLIWMTDDEFKVPVKIVTSVSIGKITAELVSAESKLGQETSW